ADALRRASRESKPQALAALLPQVSGSAARTKSDTSTQGQFPQEIEQPTGSGNRVVVNFISSSDAKPETDRWSVDLRQSVFAWDNWVALKRADRQVAQAEADYAAAQQSLILRVSEAYFNVLAAQDAVNSQQSALEAISRQLEQAEKRFEVGLIAITDVDAAQAGYDQSRANEIKAENDLNNAREAMREIVGEFEGTISSLAPEIPLDPPQPADIEAWNQRAQESNLTIIAAQNQSELAQKGIDLQFAGHLPTLDLVGTAGFTDNNRPNGIRTEVQIISMQLNMPLFQGGLVNSKVRQAREQYLAAQENLDVQRRAANKQVKIAYRGITTSISQTAALKSAVASAQSALDATEAGFEVGTRTMIDVLLVQSKLYQAKQNYAKARYDYITNSLSLKQAAGVLMREDVELVNRWLEKGGA
ncbi:MAG: TolC family outer membrane protein, partial [Candidatus Methylumidiphilus sp.]